MLTENEPTEKGKRVDWKKRSAYPVVYRRQQGFAALVSAESSPARLLLQHQQQLTA